MIEIIKEEVKMPDMEVRRYQRECNEWQNKWWVIDTHNDNKIVFKGKYPEVCIAWHNLNKKHYQNIKA